MFAPLYGEMVGLLVIPKFHSNSKGLWFFEIIIGEDTIESPCPMLAFIKKQNSEV